MQSKSRGMIFGMRLSLIRISFFVFLFSLSIASIPFFAKADEAAYRACHDSCMAEPNKNSYICGSSCHHLLNLDDAGENNPCTDPAGGNCPPTLENPLGNIKTLDALLEKILNIFIAIAYVVAAIFLLLSGFRFITAQGSQDKLKDAKNTFYYTILGIVLIAGAQVIVNVLKDTITSINTATQPAEES